MKFAGRNCANDISDTLVCYIIAKQVDAIPNCLLSQIPVFLHAYTLRPFAIVMRLVEISIAKHVVDSNIVSLLHSLYCRPYI